MDRDESPTGSFMLRADIGVASDQSLGSKRRVGTAPWAAVR